MKKCDYDVIFSKLLELFPNPDTELNYETPFQLLVAVMLSAQTTDKQVNKVTDTLFKIVKNPDDVLDMSLEAFTKAISSVNYYKMKAKHIFMTAEILKCLSKNVETVEFMSKKELEIFDEYEYYIPEDIEFLKSLPGVGEKTAKVVLYVLYKHPLIAVDTHVHRVSNRLGIVKTSNPLETSKVIEKKIPERRKNYAHHLLILFGRYCCTSKNPKCENCVIQKFCDFYKTNY